MEFKSKPDVLHECLRVQEAFSKKRLLFNVLDANGETSMQSALLGRADVKKLRDRMTRWLRDTKTQEAP